MKYVLKHGFEFGKDMYSDIREGKNVSESLKRNLRKRAGSTFTDIGEKVSQTGSGMRKKPRYQVNKKSKRNRKIRKSKKNQMF